MSERNFKTIIDFGSSKVRLANFNINSPKKTFIDERSHRGNLNLKNFNIDEANNLLGELIKVSEKKIENHIKEVVVILDTQDTNFINMTITKNLEDKILDKPDIDYLLKDAIILIQKNNSDKKILHTIIQNYIFDNQKYENLPKNLLKCKKFSLEIKFLLIPNIIVKKLEEIFKKNEIIITNIYLSSYIKSLNYRNNFYQYDICFFLDIGSNKTCLTVFDKNKLTYIRSIPIGGNHLTNDIAKIFKIDFDSAEKIKHKLRELDIIFENTLREKLPKSNIKIDINNKDFLELTKNIIHARIEEILQLSFINLNLKDSVKKEERSILIFSGNGSKILDKNSIYLSENFDSFNDINFYEETNDLVFKAAYKFIVDKKFEEVLENSKKPKKLGFFERIFNYFN